MKFNIDKILKVILILFFIDIFVDPPNNIFHIKYLLFVSIFGLWLCKIYMNGLYVNKPLVFITIFISILLPVYGLSIGIINSVLNSNELNAILYFNSFFFFLLAIVAFDLRLDLTKIFVYTSLSLVLLTLITYLILIFDTNQYLNLYRYLVINKKVAIFTLRIFGGIPVMQLFYKAVPVLVISLSYFLFKLFKQNSHYKFLDITISLGIGITLILSGTRANIIAVILVTISYLYWFLYNKSKRGFLFFNIILIICLIIAIPYIFNIFFDPNETSNSVKLGHTQSYMEIFNKYPFQFLFGEGFGSEFFSKGVNNYVQVTELTYLEIIRVFGIFVSLIFFVILLLPVIIEIIRKDFDYLFIGYVVYLFVSGTNPLLLSSTGMIVLVLVYSSLFIKIYNK